MQNAKDSFYEMLRGRLSGVQPDQTISVRGVSRPAVVADENEMPGTAAMSDCYHLRWNGMGITQEGCLPLLSLRCEISYSTAGRAWTGGLDRGRSLAAMDSTLLRMLQEPRNAPKLDYTPLANGQTAKSTGSQIWWSDPTYGEVEVKTEQLRRSVTVYVMTYAEAGETAWE